MSNKATLLYQVAQIRKLEKIAINKLGIGEDKLMQRAGKSAFAILRKGWPKARRITVVCGKGNNGGDGYVLAYLAKKARLQVKILTLAPYEDLTGAASNAASKCRKLKIITKPFVARELEGCDVIIDAIFGIGLKGNVDDKSGLAIQAINLTKVPVLALDVPSGIDADSGRVLGLAVNASKTITFIGNKIGLLIGEARNYSGKIICRNLDLPDKLFHLVKPYAQVLNLAEEIKSLPPRKPTSHKGDFGHVLVIGGDYGMGGAVRLAAEASLRFGAGLVSVATRETNALTISGVRPEIMAHAVNSVHDLLPLLQRASVCVIGPGLGQSSWGRKLFRAILGTKKPLILDADALNFLAARSQHRDNWILTPHPGEAARLLKTIVSKIQDDRINSVKKIQKNYGGVCVLKGSGTLIAASGEIIRICDAGNPGMATAGMGDVLSGIIAGFVAQGLSLFDATKLAVLIHALGGDRLAIQQGGLGILALDLLAAAKTVLNDQLRLIR